MIDIWGILCSVVSSAIFRIWINGWWFNTHAKAPCSHYDDPKPQYRPNDSKYAYSAGNAIKNSLLDTIAEQSQNPISGDTYSDNPIKETFNMEIVDELFDKKYLFKLLENHKAGKRDNYRKIWAIYSFLKWYKVYFM